MLLGCLSMAPPQHALTDASRQEAERRAKVPRASRVLTNADLDRGRRGLTLMLESGVSHDGGSTPPAPTEVPAVAEPQAPDRQGEGNAHGLPGMDEGTAVSSADAVASASNDSHQTGRGEEWWRQRAEALSTRRRRLAEQQRAVQNRVDMLLAAIAGRDDPFQRAELESDRHRALSELDALGRDLLDLDRMVSAFEESARRLSVPAGWIRVEPD